MSIFLIITKIVRIYIIFSKITECIVIAINNSNRNLQIFWNTLSTQFTYNDPMLDERDGTLQHFGFPFRDIQHINLQPEK